MIDYDEIDKAVTDVLNKERENYNELNRNRAFRQHNQFQEINEFEEIKFFRRVIQFMVILMIGEF